MKKGNQVHVYNFGFFYMPSYHDGQGDAYSDVELENGRLQAWEGDLETSYTQKEADPNWPII